MFKSTKFFIASFILAVFLSPGISSAQTAAPYDIDTSESVSSCVIINNNLSYKNRKYNNKDDVIALQDFLSTNGYLSSDAVTGFFGTVTEKAVAKFQKTNGLSATPLGFVGVGTRAKIRELSCTETATPTMATPVVDFVDFDNTSKVQTKIDTGGLKYNVQPLVVGYAPFTVTFKVPQINTGTLAYGDGQNSGDLKQGIFENEVGYSVSGQEVKHTYTQPGIYTVSLYGMFPSGKRGEVVVDVRDGVTNPTLSTYTPVTQVSAGGLPDGCTTATGYSYTTGNKCVYLNSQTNTSAPEIAYGKKCGAIGTRSEGWYNAATGKLIEYAKCSSTMPRPLPDLAIEKFSISPSTGKINEPVTATFRIVNIGNKEVSGITYDYTNQSEAYSELLPYNTCTADMVLQPGQSCLSAYSFTFSSSGYKQLEIVVDSNNKIEELTKKNNSFSSGLVITSDSLVKPTFTYSVYQSNLLKVEFLVPGKNQTCVSGKYHIEYGDGEKGVLDINHIAHIAYATGNTLTTVEGGTGSTYPFTGNVPICDGYFSSHTYKQSGTYTAKLFENSAAKPVCNATAGAFCVHGMPVPKLTQVGELKVTVSEVNPTITAFSNKDPNPVTGATYIAWNTSKEANVSLDMECTAGTISFTTSEGNKPICEKGGVWTWYNSSGSGITVTPVGNTVPVTVPFKLTVTDKNGAYTNQKKTINITFPAQKSNVSNVPTMTVLSKPKLVLGYDPTQRESSLTATYEVKITAAPTQDFKIMRYGSFDNEMYSFFVALGNGNAYGAQSNGSYYKVSGNIIDNGNYVTIPAGQSAIFKLTANLSRPSSLFAGSYYATLSLYKPSGVGDLSKPTVVGELTTNSVTIIGETSPYITGVTVDVNGVVNVTGVRFGGNSNTVKINGITKQFPESPKGGVIAFNVKDFGITQAGTYEVQVTTSKGASNGFSFIVNNVYAFVSADPTVEVIGAPSLSLQYDYFNKESKLIAKATVKITTGNSPITLYQRSVPTVFQFSNNSGVTYTKGMMFNANSSNGDNLVIPANTSVIFYVTNSAPTSELFSGVYSIKLTSLSYINSSGVNSLVDYTSFKGAGVSNSVAVIGETQPYITAVSKSSSDRYVINGQRFTLSSNKVVINGVSKILPASQAYSFASGDADLYSIVFNPSDFGITSVGSYTVQVSTKAGLSNLVSVLVAPVSFAPVVESVEIFKPSADPSRFIVYGKGFHSTSNTVTIAGNVFSNLPSTYQGSRIDVVSELASSLVGSYSTKVSNPITGESNSYVSIAQSTTPLDVKWGPQLNTPFDAGNVATSYAFNGSCYKWTTIECGSSNIKTVKGQCAQGLRYSTDFGTTSCSSLTPKITAALSPSSPVSQSVVGGSSLYLATFKLTSDRPDALLYVRELRFTTTGNDAIESISVNGMTVPVINGGATVVSGLYLGMKSELTVPVTVKFSGFMNSTTGGSLQASVPDVKLILSYVEALDTSAARSVSADVSVPSNSFTLVASKPTVTVSPVQGATLILGAENKVGEFTVTADSNGKIAINKATISVSGVGFTNQDFSEYRVTNGNTTIPNSSVVEVSPSIAVVTFDPGFEIPAGQTKTFSLYAKVTGTFVGGAAPYVTSKLVSPSTFFWRDVIGGNTQYDGSLILNFPTNSYTTSKGESFVSVFKNTLSSVSSVISQQGGVIARAFSGATNASASTGSSCVNLDSNLHRGFENSAVLLLQKFLVQKGFLSEQPSGFYGDLTIAAVKAYQKSLGLPETGMVYDFTRQMIKKETCDLI